MKNIWILAAGEWTELDSPLTTDIQETESTTQTPGQPQDETQDLPPKKNGYGSLILLGVMFVFIYMMM